MDRLIKEETLKQEFLTAFFSDEEAPIDPEEIWEWIKANPFDLLVKQGVPQPVQTAGLWVLEVDNQNEEYKILTKDKVLPVDGNQNEEQQWIASVYCINDAVNIIISHNEKIGGLSA